jgi:hypothetical protein
MMSRFLRTPLALVLLTLPALLGAQSADGKAKAAKTTEKKAEAGVDKKADKKSDKKAEKKDDKKPDIPRLFKRETPVEMTLTLNTKLIKKDKNADAPWRAASISYTDSTGKRITVPVEAKTRGIWRLKNCDYPPIRLKVRHKDANSTLLEDLDEPKLVTYCRNTDSYESYVLQEAQLYRVYRVLTDASHKVRLVKMTYADSATGKVEATRWSFLIEDPAMVAARLGGGRVKQKGAIADDLEPTQTAIAYTFLYLIANTDVSFNGLHNGEIIAFADGRNIPIAYDFDFAGIINASYAGVDPSLPIKSVRDRLFRGYCLHKDSYAAVFDQFRQKRAAIEALYTDEVGSLLPAAVTKSHLSFINDFYEDIKTPQQAQKRVLSDCVK